MRDPIITQLGGTARQVELPVPSGGLNTRESRSAMDLLDAVQFENVVSEPDGIISRRGYESFLTGMSGKVNSISDYIAGTTRKMVVGCGTVLYDSNVNGGTANSVRTGFTVTTFETAQLGGNMVLVNGADQPQIYNGTTSTDAVYTGDLQTDGPENVDGINVHKSRVYVWDTNTSDFYYGATDAIQGAFAKFPLNLVSKTGGNLLMMRSISRDGGDGFDDYAAFILDTGEVLIYQGSDPGNASNWSLVGRYFIPAPINKRSAVEFAGDVLVLTRQDVIPLSSTINASGETGGVLLKSSKLSGAIRDAFQTFGSNNDWEIVLYNNAGWFIVNVPITDGSSYFQYVNVLQTSAPSKFTGWNGTTFASFNNGLYFGGTGVVYRGDFGFSDDGSEIPCVAQQAFNTLSSGNIKNVKNVTITYLFDGTATLGANVGYDYVDKQVINLSTSTPVGSQWDVAAWDASEWSGAAAARNIKFSVAGTGRALSTVMEYNIKGARFKWLGTNLSLEIQKMI
jgi:hypothetical protein